MLVRSRAARILAGLTLGLVAIPLLLSTPWAKGRVFERLTTWARSTQGLEITAGSFTYRLPSLAIAAENVTIAGVTTPDRPLARIGRIELDLGVAILRGRLAIDALRVRDAHLVFDSTTQRQPGGATQGGSEAGRSPLENLRLGTLDVEGLDIDAAFGDRDEVRVQVHQVAAHTDGAQLKGSVSALGGGVVTVGTGDVLHLTFDRVDARTSLDEDGRIRTSLTVSTPLGQIRSEGLVPLTADAALDLDYEASVLFDAVRLWWPAAPALTGLAQVTGEVTGHLGSPQASFALTGDDFGWSRLTRARLDAAGRVSGAALELEAASLASGPANLHVSGRLAFESRAPTELTARWEGVRSDLLADLFSTRLDATSHAVSAGTATMAWRGALPQTAGLTGTVDLEVAGAAPDQSAHGSLHAEGRDDRWRVDYRQAFDGGAVVSLEGSLEMTGQGLSRSRLSGPLSVQVPDVATTIAQLQRLGLDIPAALRSVGRAHVGFEGTIDGDVSEPRMAGTLTGDGLTAGAVHDLRLVGSVAIDTSAITVTPLQVEGVGARVTLNGVLPWRETTGHGTVDVHVTDLGRLAPEPSMIWQPIGTLEIAGEWTGSARDPALTGRLAAAGAAINGLAFETVSGRVVLSKDRLLVDELRAVQPDGDLTGSASWAPGDRSITADLSGTNLTIAVVEDAGTPAESIRALLAGVSLEAHVSGDARRPEGTARVDVAAALIDGRPIGAMTGRVRAASGTAHVEAAVPALHASLEGRMGVEAPWPFDARVELTGTDLAHVTRVVGGSSALLEGLDARADATLDASGSASDVARTTATLAVTRLDGQLESHAIAIGRPGRITLQAGRLRIVDPLRIAIGSALLDVTATADSTRPGITAALSGPLSDLVSLVPGAKEADVDAEGTIDAELMLGDRLDMMQPTGRLRLGVARLVRYGQEIAREATLSADADLERVRLREVRGTVLGSTITGRAEAPLSWVFDTAAGASTVVDPATFTLDAAVAVGPLVAWLRGGQPNLSGTLNMRVEGTATAPRLEAVHAAIIDEGGAVTAAGIALKARRQTAMRLEDGRLLVDAFEWHGVDSSVNASGEIGIAGGREGTLRVDGTATLGLLSLVMPGRLDGSATFDLRLAGPSGRRTIEGRLDLSEGAMVVPAWRLSLADWAGSVTVGADSITIDGLHGQLNGGDARIDGRVPIGDSTARSDTLALTVRNAFLDVPRGLRSQFDADLQWSHERQRSRLSGTVNVTARPYREPVTELARLASVLLDGTAGASPGLPARLATTALAVTLTTNGPLTVTNSVASVELQPDLQLTGSLGRPALNGQVAVADDGRIQVSGRQYRLRDSRLVFSPEDGLMPSLAIAGETRVSDYTVSLRLSGPANEIETALSSDPPLGERELQTLIVTGQVDTLGRGGTSDQNAVGAVSGDVLGVAGQFLGFDAVTVGTTDDLALVSSDVDPALRLTVSKRLGRRFEVVLSDNLDDSELTWVIIYRPRPGFELRALSRDNTEFSGEFRQEITFGPGVSPPRTAARRRAAREQVAAVSTTGDTGFDERDVLSVTRLHAGSDFDFGRWLEDRDRIAALYHAREYLSARIVPTRQTSTAAAGPPQVTLNYRITRGPLTTLTVTGYETPPELLAELRRAWADSGLLALLDADLERVMRAHLVERGYLRASLDVEIDNRQADRVAATIAVQPGPISSDRRLSFSGNVAFDEEALVAGAEAADVAARAWLDSMPLVEWLRAAYADKGYLAAEVIVDAASYAGSIATLPVRIVEGPMARVATLTVSGTDQVPEAEAAAATGLTVGGPYVFGSEQVGRLALERYYRSLGYRDASVTSAADVSSADGRVNVTLMVAEGRRYVVRSVRTTGVESTRASLVERATRIEPGTPASSTVAETARRQLYDIGTFRSADVTFEPVDATPGAGPVPVDAVVSLQESKRFLFLYGVEVTNQYQSLFDQRVSSGGVAADVRDRNFLGRGWTLGGGLRYEPSFKSARAIATVPRLGSRRIRTNVYADVRSEDRARTEDFIFRDDETTVTIEQRWRPWRPIELSWGYRYDFRDLQFLDAESERELVGFKGTLASLAGAAVVDRRDNLFDARRGWLASVTAEWGLEAVGSDLGYLRTVARASHYQPLGPLTLASSVRWGNLMRLTGRPPLTVLDIFFTAGGTQTVRGYQQDSLSADYLVLGDTRVPIGGTKLLVLNGEVRAPLFWIVSAAGFVDAGNTFNELRGIAFDDLAVGAGFGLRIRTPLAPVRIDLGFPLSKWTGQTSIRWHFSIGQMF